MLEKFTRAGYWENGRPVGNILDITNNGKIDNSHLEKTAVYDEILKLSIDKKPNHSYVHLITTGAGEFYGPNSNNDYYNESSRVIKFPHKSRGLQKTATLDKGLKGYHDKTYMEKGAVYHNHKNSKKGFKPEGFITFAKYNDDMHRGELIIELNNDKWANELQKIASGEPVYFSQGSSVPTDMCSYCGNRASVRSNYCEHLRFSKHSIDKEGNQIYAINDTPIFHDISCVGVPADKIAFGLRKVASLNSEAVDELLYDMQSRLYVPETSLYKTASHIISKKRDILQKLAAIEKKVLLKSVGNIADLSDAFNLSNEDDDSVSKELSGIPLPKILKVMSKERMMLPPKQFIRITIGKPLHELNDVSGLSSALSTVFNNILSSNGLDNALNDGTFSELQGGCPHMQEISKIRKLRPLLSLDPEPIQHRIIKITITRHPVEPKEKEASTPSESAKYLAKEYAKYQLSFLSSSPETSLESIIAMNRSI